MNNIQVSIIIPTYKRKDLLKKCLAALSKIKSNNFEVIVVNDCPQDDLGDVLDPALSAKTKIFSNKENLGPAASRNFGAAQAQGELLAFIDDDVIVAENWIDLGVISLAKADVLAMVGETILPKNQFPHPLGHFMINDRPGRYPSCNLWVRKSAFDKVGGFSLDFFDSQLGIFHHEDADLCFRLMDWGRIDFNQELLAEHPIHSYSWRNPLRSAKKVFFDALLFKRHPKKYGLLTKRCFLGFCLKKARTRIKILNFCFFILGLILLLTGDWLAAAVLLLLGILMLKLDVFRIIGWRNIFKIKIGEWPAIIAVQFLALIYFNFFLLLGMIRAMKFFL
ncbi:MAG: glycosyltransferase [Candidatus Pacebacteria bacterium]|jgi:glycosyltransferase involved in cell wall biosynthesis|nr:glycosyltransferase [Candidatus Paceibacterota bacterium]